MQQGPSQHLWSLSCPGCVFRRPQDSEHYSCSRGHLHLEMSSRLGCCTRRDGKIIFLRSKLYFQWLLLRQKGVLVCWVHGCSDSCSQSKAIFGFNHMLLDMYGFCMFSIVALILVQQELEWFSRPNFLDWCFSVNLMALKSSYWKGWAHRAD